MLTAAIKNPSRHFEYRLKVRKLIQEMQMKFLKANVDYAAIEVEDKQWLAYI